MLVRRINIQNMSQSKWVKKYFRLNNYYESYQIHKNRELSVTYHLALNKMWLDLFEFHEVVPKTITC